MTLNKPALLCVPLFLLGLAALGCKAPAAQKAQSSAQEAPVAQRERWSVEQAQAWGEKSPWLVGANFTPASAINQLEMWQADSFDPEQIDKELAWANSLGFNSMRVFLHHLLWEQDAQGLLQRMDQFLAIAERHKIGVMFVLFDSVWDPNPKLGKQREPQKGLHNSGWVQSPGGRHARPRRGTRCWRRT
jgi:hypothetical protein